MKEETTIHSSPTLTWPIWIGLMLVVLTLALSIAVVFLPYTVDDAFITFRYARNLRDGLGPVFNLGERVEGYTSFLWMLLMSAGLRLGLDVVAWSRALGLASGLTALGVTMSMGRYVSEQPRRVALLSGLLLAASVDVGVNSTAGLETALFMLLITGAVARQMREEQKGGLPLAPWLYGLAALTRPEGLAYALAGLSYALVTRRAEPGRTLLRWLPMGVLIGAHLAWRYSYYGDLLPNPYYAKSIPLAPRLVVGVIYLLEFFADYAWIFPVAWLFALVQRNRRLRLPLLVTAVGAAAVVWEGGDWMERNRFLVPILPLLCLITADVLSRMYDQMAQRWRRVAQGVVTAVLVLYVTANARALVPLQHYTSVRAEGYEKAHRPLARWLDETLPPSASVALMDIGTIGYYTDLYILDITGLTDSTIGHSPGVFLQKSYDVGYVLDQAPEVIVLVSWDQDEEPDFFVDKAIYRDPDFTSSYDYDHKLEHHHDPELGDYYLLVYRRNQASGEP